MADPQKLPSGAWRVQWHDSAGTRRSSTFKTYEAARSALRRKLTEVEDIRAGRSRPRAEQTIDEVSDEWLATRKPDPNAAPAMLRRQTKRHADNRQHLERHIKPILGELRLPQVTPTVVAAFVKRLEGTTTKRPGEVNADQDADGNPKVQRTLRPSTIRNVVTTLRKMLGDLGYPIRASVKVPRAGYDWIRTEGEVVRFLGACGDGWFRVCCSLAIYAGLRRGEVAALTWHAIDFVREVILIDRSWSGPTKSGKPRVVPLAAELATLLKRWRLQTGGTPRDLVVRVERAHVVDGEREAKLEGLTEEVLLAKLTRRACKAAGIEPITYHQLRHTFATMVAERMPLPAVKELLGHADITTTARYAHADSATAARDPRARLSFGGAGATVVALTATASGRS
jgi:integrase